MRIATDPISLKLLNIRVGLAPAAISGAVSILTAYKGILVSLLAMLGFTAAKAGARPRTPSTSIKAFPERSYMR